MATPNHFDDLLKQHYHLRRHIPSVIEHVFRPTLYALFGWKWRGLEEPIYQGDGLGALLSMLSYAVRMPLRLCMPLRLQILFYRWNTFLSTITAINGAHFHPNAYGRLFYWSARLTSCSSRIGSN